MKPIIVTMVYANANILRSAMAAYRRTTADLPPNATHVFVDQCYPLRHDEVRAEILKQVASIPCNTVLLSPGRNMGLHQGFNYAIETQKIADDDIVIGYDADEHPTHEGWLTAMLDVFRADPDCGWLSIGGPQAIEFMNNNGCNRTKVAGHNVWRPPYPLVNHVTGFRGKAIREVGPFREPFEYYGGIESEMQPAYNRAGYYHGYLVDYLQQGMHHLHDPEYAEWKWKHVRDEFKGDFSAFLHASAAV